MKLVFSEQAWEDYLYWQTHDKKILQRINALLKEIMRSPYAGTGKPEALKHALAGYWSRRINAEHRLVYKALENEIWVVQLRYHY
ncbi:MAG: Txe/YoeB family addiction module toxin [Brachymonas sp.]